MLGKLLACGCLVVLMISGSVVLVGFLVSQDSSTGSSAPDPTPPGSNPGLSYLAHISDVRWYYVDGNSVYIGFNPIPADLSAIVGGAALRGSTETDSEFRAWAVDARVAGESWRPGGDGFVCEATGRGGFIAENGCK